jgi:hypothetical protein
MQHFPGASHLQYHAGEPRIRKGNSFMKSIKYLSHIRGRSAGGARARSIRRPLAQVMAAIFLIFAAAFAGGAQTQDNAPASTDPLAPVFVHAPGTPDVSISESPLTHRPGEVPAAAQTIALTVPKGTPVHVVVDKEARIKKVGEAIHGHVVEPVYAFDRMVIPAGAEVTGEITKIEGVSGGRRTAAALDADLTPARKVEVEFNQINLPGGKQIPVRTRVTPGSGQMTEFVSAGNANHGKGTPDAATERTRKAKQAAKQEWDTAMKQVKEPGKLHRLERFAVAELPVHPQYLEAGALYFAELQEPLDFGTEPLTPQFASSIGMTIPEGSVVAARLVTPLSSATAHPGDEVEAIVSRPLFDGDRLIVPAGSVLKGTVVQVHAAHRMGRNGELRPVFRELVLPEGVEKKVEASLAAVQAAKAEDLKLDAEGGAHATASPTRFLNTALSVGLGAFSVIGDSGGGDIAHREAGGAGGYKLIGIAMGAAIHSQPLGIAMGAFGASRSIYANFIARGRDVVLPKNTAMDISIGTRTPPAAPAASAVPAETETAKP